MCEHKKCTAANSAFASHGPAVALNRGNGIQVVYASKDKKSLQYKFFAEDKKGRFNKLLSHKIKTHLPVASLQELGRDRVLVQYKGENKAYEVLLATTYNYLTPNGYESCDPEFYNPNPQGGECFSCQINMPALLDEQTALDKWLIQNQCAQSYLYYQPPETFMDEVHNFEANAQDFFGTYIYFIGIYLLAFGTVIGFGYTILTLCDVKVQDVWEAFTQECCKKKKKKMNIILI